MESPQTNAASPSRFVVTLAIWKCVTPTLSVGAIAYDAQKLESRFNSSIHWVVLIETVAMCVSDVKSSQMSWLKLLLVGGKIVPPFLLTIFL